VKVTVTEIPDVLILESVVFNDERGFFFESYNQKNFEDLTGLTVHFVQDNRSNSTRHVLRGLHYQIKQPQGKLIQVSRGEIFDVAVDLRRRSSTFGKWTGVRLSGENKKQIWVPEGFAHGFLVLSEAADVLYKVTDYYAPQHECALLWNDPRVGITWPIDHEPLLSAKDRSALPLSATEVFA
jgi:dTDP-4-dehydrorhamnose 3,5-epimerase